MQVPDQLEREKVRELVQMLLVEVVDSVDKRLKCSRCPATFRDKWNLNRHAQLHAALSELIPCSKSWCKARFSTIFELSQHVSKCKFSCGFCGKDIFRSGREIGHMKQCAKWN